MEPGSQKEPIGEPIYRIVWHPLVKEDLSKVPKNLTKFIVKAAEHRLSRAPHLIGPPLKGTTRLLWKIKFDKHRIVYTINTKANEVWILPVQKREVVYRDRHIQSLVNLAIALRQRGLERAGVVDRGR